MIKATNPLTDNVFELEDNTEINEIVTDSEDGSMFEVVDIENGVAKLKEIEVEEDWGE